MWYRIEQNKDGTIGSCVQVAMSKSGEGRSIHYVEADSAESACKILLDRYERAKAINRQGQAKVAEKCHASGVCIACGKPNDRGTRRCGECTAKATARRAAVRRGEAPPEFKKAKTAEEKAERAKSLTDRRRNRPGTVLSARRVVLQRVAAAFDRMTPRNFRTWLGEELLKAQEAEAASAAAKKAKAAA